MSSVIGGLPAAIAGAANVVSNVAWFVPMLVAAIAYFQYDNMDPEARPINIETSQIFSVYDFIIVGAGSAGKLFHIT